MNSPKKKGLGRGLGALLDANSDSASTRQDSLPVGRLQPGRYQPRTRMDPDSLNELAASIKAQGIMQPILVRLIGDDKYEIIAGERRWRAAQLAGMSEVPVLVREIPDEATLAMSLIENIQRENLNPLEEAAGIQRLIDEFGMSHQQAADAVGRSRPAASNLLRLLNLAKPVQECLFSGELDMGHARALLPLAKPEQARLAALVVHKRLSVRETEKLVQRELQSPPGKAGEQKADRDVLRLQEELADILGAPVKLVAGKKGAGHLTIGFSSLDQLDGILERLRDKN
ncbi:putative chromosome-partitioning protein ParB [Sterolibacterium denitrificans]|uniref:Chromosome-partitioning protein ParB n=1 Tax=Sterolibacterium denitrificans TaxID=157592 RepID=A0A7Z7HP38_9PROT|nr:ParB/RepB/Spo0J family partition protein [Sterolibacterium denitrificans]SMB21712.1 putative chromosome-partitioning protein ParB [Sterolibacterium denitrificans]